MKLANRLNEAIDLDGFRPEQAKMYVKSKRVFETSLGRIISTTGRMLKSLELMTQEERKSSNGAVAIKATKRILSNINKLKSSISNISGIRSLVMSGENKKVLALIVETQKAIDFLDRSRNKDLGANTKKQIQTYLDFLEAEFKNWEGAIDELL